MPERENEGHPKDEFLSDSSASPLSHNQVSLIMMRKQQELDVMNNVVVIFF